MPSWKDTPFTFSQNLIANILKGAWSGTLAVKFVVLTLLSLWQAIIRLRTCSVSTKFTKERMNEYIEMISSRLFILSTTAPPYFKYQKSSKRKSEAMAKPLLKPEMSCFRLFSLMKTFEILSITVHCKRQFNQEIKNLRRNYKS